MLSLCKTVSRDCLLVAGESNFICSPFNHQSVRWRRKPFWLPVAKSKVFRIPKKPTMTEEEDALTKKLFNVYRTEIKSLKRFFADEIKASETGAEVIAEMQKIEMEEHMKCLQINDEWNAKVASMRLARLAMEKEHELENIIRELEENKRKKEERKQQMEALVKKEKERSKTYITPQNLDEAIELALSTTVDYEFALDIEGNRYIGRNARPNRPDKSKPLLTEEST